MNTLRAHLSDQADVVAPLLLGCVLSAESDSGTVAVVLTEVEAYLGEADPASHAYRGITARNSMMFGEAGRLYVYRSYGIHWCLNVVTGSVGAPSAVLLRAGRVVDGLDVAQERRGSAVRPDWLARGPGNLGQALGVTGADNGADLLGAGRLHLTAGEAGEAGEPGVSTGPRSVSTGPRTGVRLGHETPLRYWLTNEPSVSPYRRSPRLRA